MNVKVTKPDDKVFSFNDLVRALEAQGSAADLEPFGDLVGALAVALEVELDES